MRRHILPNVILFLHPLNAKAIERYNKQAYNLQLIAAFGSGVVTGLEVKAVVCGKGSVVSGRWVPVPKATDMHENK